VDKDLHILVVDDTAVMRTMLRRSLSSLGFKNITDCRSAEEALDKLHESSFDLIISDWSMPKMSGLEFFQELQHTERLKKVPFLVITANTDRRTVLTALKAGIVFYVTKPFTLEALREKVEAVLTPQRVEESAKAAAEHLAAITKNTE
jgi:two-component system chemotaxis response regulator CheY